MSDFLDLLNYLKIGRQSQLAQENEQFRYAEVFDENYNPNNIPVEIEVLKANLENNALYRNLETQFIGQSTVYASFIDNVRKYYFKRQSDGKYRDILEFDIASNWIVIPNDSAFIAIPLELDKQSYYYDHVLNKLIRLSLEGVTITGDTFMYKPTDFEQFPAGEYTYNFKDNEGNKTNWKRWLAPHLLSLSQNKREVVLSKASVRHKAYLLPLMSKQFFGGYSLKYYYKTNKVEPDMLQHDGYVAIKLNFNHITTCLSFLNETVFYQLDEPSSFNTKMRQEFLKCYRKIVIKRLEWIKNDNITEVLAFLYYIPDGVIKTLNKEFLWNVVSRALNQPLTNFGTDSEDIVLNLLILIAEMEGNADAFLKRLLKEPKEKESIFRLLYKRMNGENFMRTIKLLRNIWLQSGYTDFENPEYEKTNNPKEPVSPAPIFLPYKSEKFIGFYSSNKNFDFSKNSYIEVTPDESWIDNIIGVIDPDLGKWVESKVEEQTIYHYHPYYPLMLTDVDQESTIELPRLMPAFFLKANEDKAFWSNVITAAEYTADVLTTVSGVGNIAKFRHLARVAEVASKAAKFNKARKYASLVSKIRLAVGVVEISSGTVNALIKLSGVDTPFSRALQKYLFYLELLSLGGELTVAIHGGLRRTAKNLVEKPEDAALLQKKLDELVEEGKIARNEADDVIGDLERVAEVERKLGNFLFELQKGDTITEEFIKKIVKQVRESTRLKNFEINLVDRNNEKYKKLFDQWQKGGGQGFFKPTSGEFGIHSFRGLIGEGPQIYMFAGKTVDEWGIAKNVLFTKYTLQHELFHLEMFMYLKNKTPNYIKYWKEIPTYMHEQYVLNRLLKTKNWNKNDLLSDLEYVNLHRKAFNSKLENITLKELETWKFEIELEKIGIKIQ